MPASAKRKAPGKLVAPVVKSSANVPTKNTIDETRASIAGTDVLQSSQMIEISSDAASDDEDVSDAEMEEAAVPVNGNINQKEVAEACVNGKQIQTEEGKDEAEEESDNGETSPSFGELLRGNDTIDVPALLQQSSTVSNMITQPTRTSIVPPSHQSLTTVLTQALKSDDTELLESCLHTTDLPTVRNTIERIDSSLAGNLLTKLAARLHRRPGRAGNLMTWVQWTLVSHGGALASQPKVVQSLNGLQKVLAERAKGLNSLLALKGKLDLLESQMELRRKMHRTSSHLPQDDSGNEDEDDDEVIWVEGEIDPVSRKDLNGHIANAKKRRNQKDLDSDDDDEVEGKEEIHASNMIDDSQDEEEDSDSQQGDNSDAAEESLDENEVDHDDVDEPLGEDDESEVEAAAPPSKMQKVSKIFSKKK